MSERLSDPQSTAYGSVPWALGEERRARVEGHREAMEVREHDGV